MTRTQPAGRSNGRRNGWPDRGRDRGRTALLVESGARTAPPPSHRTTAVGVATRLGGPRGRTVAQTVTARTRKNMAQGWGGTLGETAWPAVIGRDRGQDRCPRRPRIMMKLESETVRPTVSATVHPDRRGEDWPTGRLRCRLVGADLAVEKSTFRPCGDRRARVESWRCWLRRGGGRGRLAGATRRSGAGKGGSFPAQAQFEACGAGLGDFLVSGGGRYSVI